MVVLPMCKVGGELGAGRRDIEFSSQQRRGHFEYYCVRVQTQVLFLTHKTGNPHRSHNRGGYLYSLGLSPALGAQSGISERYKD